MAGAVAGRGRLLVVGLLGCLLCLGLLPQPTGAFLARPPLPTLSSGLRAPRWVPPSVPDLA